MSHSDYEDRPPRRTGDLIVKPQEFAFILDETKGQVSVIVGPQKMSLAGTDKTVVFDPKQQRFIPVDLERAVSTFVSAPKGSYVELQNPAKSTTNPHPNAGTINSLAELQHGCKVNLAGPCNFPMWPGQVVAVLEGHNLRSNQYLICRVYDDDAAKDNIEHAVIKATSEDEGETKHTGRAALNLLPTEDELVTGKLFIIKGTDVSFFIPPNGIEVLPDSENRYIREAVTLEQLEYCILLDENGGKRFERGPQVVFPKPTERFLRRTVAGGELKRSAPDAKRTSSQTRRFRAIELNDISGIYVKVIAAYEENGRKYQEGEELWITGKEQRIYFPRPEHSLIKYGDREIHYAVAVPKGESKYVLDRETGKIELVRGPAMFLPDPRKQVLVRRILGTDEVSIWFPGNNEALQYNATLSGTASAPTDKFVTERQFSTARPGSRARALSGNKSFGVSSVNAALPISSDEIMDLYAATAAVTPYDEGDFNDEPAATDHGGESMGRNSQFTRPLSISIDSKYDGAVIVRPWTGYAIQIVDGEGNRRVVQGPAVVHLEYDESPERFTLSTGQRKSADHVLRDVYLRVLNNRVSDVITVETADMVRIDVSVSYRVNFEGDPNLWFNVENYVQHLCDNMRSILRNVAKQYDIQSFYNNYIEVVRNTIVPQNADGVREGRLFAENGMRITEVEVLECKIGDTDIQYMLEQAQQETAQALIQLNQGKKQFELEQANATLETARAQLRTATDAAIELEHRSRIEEKQATAQTEHTADIQAQRRAHEANEIKQANRAALQAASDASEKDRQKTLDAIANAEIARETAKDDRKLSVMQAQTEDYINRLRAEAAKEVEISGSIQPGLVEALTALGQTGMLEKITGELAPLAIVKGLSIGGAVQQLFEGTPFAGTVQKLVDTVDDGNGSYGGRFAVSKPEHNDDRF